MVKIKLTMKQMEAVSPTRVALDAENKNAGRLSTIRDPGTFRTPFPNDLSDIVPKEMKDFRKEPKFMYHINPNTKQELDNMLAYSENTIPKPNEDLIDITSQRFEKIQADYAKRAATTTKILLTTRKVKSILRQNTSPPPEIAQNARTRAFALMTQFVYGARYKLTYGQKLRALYNHTNEFKIGHCFATMRDTRQKQLSLYSTMRFNLQRHYDYQYHKQRNPMYFSILEFADYLEIYEKIVRFDVDLMDTIRYAKQLEELRKAEKQNHTADLEITTVDSDKDSGDG